jgi:tetratricopeptide (TPR) repeat protein
MIGLVPPLLFLSGFAAYLFCLGPWSGWLDSGELLTGAHHLGVSHPPGQPLHALLAKAFQLLPAGGIAFRGTLLSAVAGAACWPILYGWIMSLIRAVEPARRSRDPWVPALAAAVAIAFGLTAPMALESTRAEVYALTLAAVLVAIRLVAAWHEEGDARCLMLFALCVGLAAGAHPLLAAVVAVSGTLFALAAAPRRAALGAGGSLAALALGAAVLLVLPLRAGAGSAFAWGDPQRWSSFLSTATGAPYARTYAGGGDPLWDRISGHLGLVAAHVGWEMAVLGVLGLGLLVLRRWRMAILVAGAALGGMGTAIAQRVFYAQNPDVSGYLLFTLALLLAAAALPMATPAPRIPRRVASAVALFGAAAVVLATPFGLRRADGHAETYVRAALAAAPARALVVVGSDHAAFPILYAQRVEGERLDVRTAIAPLLTSSWYLRTLKRWWPDLFVPFVDDGRRDALEARLVRTNAAVRPVLREPVGLVGADLGILSRIAGGGAPADALAQWERYLSLEEGGDLTRWIRGFAAMRRATVLADRGALGRAAAAILALLHEDAAWLEPWEALARARRLPLPAPPSLRPAAPLVPRMTRAFLYSDAEASWRAGDLLWALGLPGLASPWLAGCACAEGKVVAALHAWRSGNEEAGERALAELGERARDGRVALARALAGEGRRDTALKVVDELVRAEDPGALALAGVWEAERGNLGAAENLLRRSLALRPGAVEPLTNLGLVYAKQGRLRDAESAWREAARDPGGHRARALLAKLRAENP